MSSRAHGVGVRSARSGVVLFYGGGVRNARNEAVPFYGDGGGGNTQDHAQLNPLSNALEAGSIANPLPSVTTSLIRFVQTSWVLRYRLNIQLQQ